MLPEQARFNQGGEMPELKHTPGPWGVCPDPGADCGECGESQEEAFLVGPQMPTGVGVRTGLAVVLVDDNAEANAMLMAAAPDLLAACQLWDQGFTDGEQFTEEQFWKWVNDNRRAARAAIAKALGQS